MPLVLITFMATIKATILSFLDNNLYKDAIYLSEINHAEYRNDETLYLLALSYYKSQKISSSHKILSQETNLSPKCRLLLVQSCYELMRFHEAEKALFLNLDPESIKTQLVSYYGDLAPIAAKYAGSIYEKTSRSEEAAHFFKTSLKLNPYLFSAAEALARLEKSSSIIISTALKKQQPIEQQTTVTQLPTTHETFMTPAKFAPLISKTATRRSSRLFSVIANNQTPATRGCIASAQTAILGNAPAKKLRRSINQEQELTLDTIGNVYLLRFQALEALYHYKLNQALETLNELPIKHRETGWVLCCFGRTYYEKTDYNESVRYYEQARRLEPYRVEGMEYYSSALWHLHKEVELSTLAKELMDFDEQSAETWCVAGNCYSLQKEHESAISYLEKAIKVDPNCAYAYTLLGHELVSTERLDQAMSYFRTAKRLDPQHWNAWCGLGCVYFKNEKYREAELYYRKALQIAPSNPVLMCQLAVVQHACKKSEAAIRTLTEALAIDPTSALCKFHRATIYSALERNEEALDELDDLRQLVPEESMVYFLIGKIHKKMGNTDTALITFSWSTQLDPKGANNPIREVIDKQRSGDDDVVVHRDAS